MPPNPALKIFIESIYPQIGVISQIVNIKEREEVRQHLIININGKIYSLTSSPYVTSYHINRLITFTNFIGFQNNGKRQFALNMEEGFNFDNRFYISNEVPISLLRRSNLLYKEETIGFFGNIYFSLLVQEKWNTLRRGENEYNYWKREDVSDDVKRIHNEIKNLNNNQIYWLMWNSSSNYQKFMLQQKFHCHKKKINYMSEEEFKNKIKNDIERKKIENADKLDI